MFDLFLALHVLAAVAGFAAIGATGAHAAALRRAADPFASGALVRFFSPGRNLAARSVLLVPLFGAVLLGLGNDASRLYPWLGLGLWTVAIGLASSIVWPGERRIQQAFSGAPPESHDAVCALGSVAARVERGAAATTLCFLLALVVMIAQPG